MTSTAVGGVLVAAGRSGRMGFDKVWVPLAGRPVLSWGIAMLAASGISDIVLVVAVGLESRATELESVQSASARVVTGGPRRRDSVAAGVSALGRCEWVVVHDAARPLAGPELVRDGLIAAERSGAAVPALAVSDTVKELAGGRVVRTLARERLALIQTPQVFRRDLLLWALHACPDDSTDEAGLLERLGAPVYTFPGSAENIKLTGPGDLTWAETLLAQRSADVARP